MLAQVARDYPFGAWLSGCTAITEAMGCPPTSCSAEPQPASYERFARGPVSVDSLLQSFRPDLLIQECD